MIYIASMFNWIWYIMCNIKIPFPITTDYVPMFSIANIFLTCSIIAIVVMVIKFVLIPAFVPYVEMDKNYDSTVYKYRNSGNRSYRETQSKRENRG